MRTLIIAALLVVTMTASASAAAVANNIKHNNNKHLHQRPHVSRTIAANICPTFSRERCFATPFCFYNELGFCMAGCGAYETQASCAADITCQWDSNSESCFNSAQGCEALASRSECENHKDTCYFGARNALPGCYSTCEGTYPDQRSCNADKFCMWDPYNAVCGSSCATKYATPYQCNTLSLGSVCQWTTGLPQQNPAGVCAPNCTGLTQSVCNNDRAGQCSFNFNTQTCQLDCPFYSGSSAAASAQCQSMPQCFWNAPLNYCMRSCSMQRDEIECRENVNCRWFVNNNSCENSGFIGCPVLTDEVECNQFPASCQWIVQDGIPQCHNKCGLQTNQAACQQTPLCFWNGVENKCRVHCADRYRSMLACLDGNANDEFAHCIWLRKEATCATNCSKYTPAQCNNVNPDQCIFSVGKGCTPSCRHHSTALSCANNLACTWNYIAGCRTSCTSYLNEDTCRDHVICRWFVNNNSCSNTVDGCPALDTEAECDKFSDACAWKVINGIPQCTFRM